MPQVKVNDALFHVVDEGQGPPLLLVHGFPLDHSMWRHQISHFATTHRVIAPDLRGFGQSSPISGRVTMKRLADDLAGMLPALGENRPVIFCGLSMGGYVAWQFVEHHRSKLAALIVCDTKAAPDTPEAKKTRLESADRLEREGTSFLSESMLPKLFGDAFQGKPKPFVTETAEVILRSNPGSCAAALRGMSEREDYRPRLSAIDLPTLVICGEKDTISPPQEMKEIAAAIPGARYVEIPRSSHMAPLQSPELVNPAMEEFLKSLCGTAVNC